MHELEDAEVVLRRGMDNTVERAVRASALHCLLICLSCMIIQIRAWWRN